MFKKNLNDILGQFNKTIDQLGVFIEDTSVVVSEKETSKLELQLEIENLENDVSKAHTILSNLKVLVGEPQ